MTDLEKELHTMRNAHAGASRRAARAWTLIMTLANKRVLIPVDKALNRVAEAIYYSARYDAMERYGDIDEFKESLSEDLNKKFERCDHAEAAHYVVRPFFATNSEFLYQLGLGYIQGYCSLAELDGLEVKPMAATNATQVAGLTDEETEALAALHRRNTLTLVNLLRKCATAMHYVCIGLTNQHNTAPGYADAVKDDDIASLVSQLEAACDLPFEPPAASHFGTDADKRNVLRTLAEGAGLDRLLLEP